MTGIDTAKSPKYPENDRLMQLAQQYGVTLTVHTLAGICHVLARRSDTERLWTQCQYAADRLDILADELVAIYNPEEPNE